MSNKYISLSYILSPQLSCYNNEHNIKVFPYKNREKTLKFFGHIGTHIDVPYHIFEQGKKITDYQVKDFIFFNVAVVDVTPKENYVEASELENVAENIDFLIIRTGQFNHRNEDKYVLENSGVSPEAACYLRKKCPCLKAIGIDSISLNAYHNKEKGRMAHKIFLGQQPEILVVEDMNLSSLGNNKIKQLFLSPLIVEECDGALCSVIAEVE